MKRAARRSAALLVSLSSSFFVGCADRVADEFAACEEKGVNHNSVFYDDGTDFGTCAVTTATVGKIGDGDGFETLDVVATLGFNESGVTEFKWFQQLDEDHPRLAAGSTLEDATASAAASGTNIGNGVDSVVVDDISVDGGSGTISMHGNVTYVDSPEGGLLFVIRDAPITTYEGADKR